jgi:hypothetical protein
MALIPDQRRPWCSSDADDKVIDLVLVHVQDQGGRLLSRVAGRRQGPALA